MPESPSVPKISCLFITVICEGESNHLPAQKVLATVHRIQEISELLELDLFLNFELLSIYARTF